MTDRNEGWTEWSKHVLKELERLNDSHETIRARIEEVQKDIVEIKSNATMEKNGFSELQDWKKSIDEVVSPTQLKELCEKVSDLEKFKIKMVTGLLFLQIILGIILKFI